MSLTTIDSLSSLNQYKGLPAVETTEGKVALDFKFVVLRDETLTSMKSNMNTVART
jgi:hypothetical protein